MKTKTVKSEMNRSEIEFCREQNYRHQTAAIFIAWIIIAVVAACCESVIVGAAFTGMSVVLVMEYAMCIVSIKMCDAALQDEVSCRGLIRGLVGLTVLRNTLFVLSIAAFAAGIIF